MPCSQMLQKAEVWESLLKGSERKQEGSVYRCVIGKPANYMSAYDASKNTHKQVHTTDIYIHTQIHTH